MIEKLKRKKKFKELLLSQIAKSINEIFGKDTAKTVYYYLEKNYSLKLEDIPEKPEVFSKALESMFGKLGAEVIETFLIKNVSSKFEVTYQRKEGYGFSDYVNELMHSGILQNKHACKTQHHCQTQVD